MRFIDSIDCMSIAEFGEYTHTVTRCKAKRCLLSLQIMAIFFLRISSNEGDKYDLYIIRQGDLYIIQLIATHLHAFILIILSFRY